MIATDKIKTTLTLSKAIYSEMCILELSKTPTYEFHYDYITKKYDNKSILLFTDTDSLVYGIQTENDYDKFSKNK